MQALSTRSLPGRSFRAVGAFSVHRTLPEEVPTAVVFNGSTLAVMMATPDDIADFAYGFALTEGVITRSDEVESFEVVSQAQGIEARFWLRDDRAEALSDRRRFMAGPVGCGLCGIDSLEQAMRPLPRVSDGALRLSRAEVAGATDALRPKQELHAQTRATHAAGFLVPGQGIDLVREDVGRHNALDKLIGALMRAGIDPASGVAVMTSRLSVELVQKCAMSGVPGLVGVSAPTARAVHLAEEAGVTLVAFARAGGFDIYSHAHRIADGVTNVA
ncbi:formate dehydrogenase accessory sulfurtransferase FdhD [Sedimentitalea sp. JM2-8]|uniref:Sulfur carrier protein FdhD n=1 Tax=Sedimentitalea xiamensis TaxID=3050037 RepID=A0ABT7FEL9_9RHOB|nr:formate dehydrogenase accessory sulfurtransferase FdhD [Sedimentitalea xiamensis]MDK3073562.1 formate dehydrogenase accessory sulfurtransferase FdhD [Sedimentitalea xiamensis]